MSEFQLPDSVKNFNDNETGYPGHLRIKLFNLDHHVILFDEIEKNHTQIWDLFLQMFRPDRLHSSKGRRLI